MKLTGNFFIASGSIRTWTLPALQLYRKSVKLADVPLLRHLGSRIGCLQLQRLQWLRRRAYCSD